MDEPVLYRETFVIVGDDFEHGGDAAAAVKLVLKDLGLDPAVIRRLSIANFEAEMNVIMYASEARMDLVITPSEVRVMVADCGPGIIYARRPGAGQLPDSFCGKIASADSGGRGPD